MLYLAAVLMKLGSSRIPARFAFTALFDAKDLPTSPPSRDVAERCRRTLPLFFLAWVGGFAALSGHAHAQAPAPLALETGKGAALQRQSISLEHVSPVGDSALRFEIDWFSNEIFAQTDLSDAFTVTLRNSARSYVATLVTVDAWGPIWLPTTPGAAQLTTNDLLTAVQSVSSTESVASHLRLQGLLRLPEVLRTQALVLSVSLFDNLDMLGSKGVLMNYGFAPRIDLPIELESSEAVVGPFARQSDARLDRAAMTFTVPKVSSQRFFRLESLTSSRIQKLSRAGDEWLLDYESEMGQPELLLEGSEDQQKYFRVSNAIIDLAAGKATVPLFRAPAFFRLRGTHPVRIVGDEVTGENRILRFEVFPPVPTVLSSVQPDGPFARTAGTVVDPFSKRVRIPGLALARFFRLRSELPLLVREVREIDSQLIIYYEEP